MPAPAQPIRAVLFDLDGTLLDTAPDFVEVVNQLRAEEGMAPLPAPCIRDEVSNGASALVTLAFGYLAEDPLHVPMRERLLDLYERVLGSATVFFEGMDEVLAQIASQNLFWGLATNKPARFTLPLIHRLGLSPHTVICPDDVTERKPHPESLHLAASQLNISPQEIIYVGDHERDIECGRRAQSVTVAARFGYIDNPSEVEQWQADHIIDHASELVPLIRHYGGQLG